MAEKVRLIGDPVLSTPCAPIADLAVYDINTLVTSMTETMLAENGIGLAANQIGHSVRVFIMKNDDQSVATYINPVIISGAHEINFPGEACLSVPGISAQTIRYNEITLSWIDRMGTPQVGTFEGIKAFAVQHEMDHLNGKLYLDQFGPVKKDLYLRKYRKFHKKNGR